MTIRPGEDQQNVAFVCRRRTIEVGTIEVGIIEVGIIEVGVIGIRGRWVLVGLTGEVSR